MSRDLCRLVNWAGNSCGHEAIGIRTPRQTRDPRTLKIEPREYWHVWGQDWYRGLGEHDYVIIASPKKVTE